MEPLSLQSDEAQLCNRHADAVLPTRSEIAVHL
jgi:hypothetical protein